MVSLCAGNPSWQKVMICARVISFWYV